MSKLNRTEKRLITHLEHTLDVKTAAIDEKDECLEACSEIFGRMNAVLRVHNVPMQITHFRRMGTPGYAGTPQIQGGFLEHEHDYNPHNDQQLRELREQLEAKDRLIAQLQRQVETKDGHSANLQRQLRAERTRNNQLQVQVNNQGGTIQELKTRLILGPVKVQTVNRPNIGMNIKTSGVKRASNEINLTSQPDVKRATFGAFGIGQKSGFAAPITFSSLKTNPFASFRSGKKWLEKDDATTAAADAESSSEDEAFSTELPPEVDDPDTLPSALAEGECQLVIDENAEINDNSNFDTLLPASTESECQSVADNEDDAEPLEKIEVTENNISSPDKLSPALTEDECQLATNEDLDNPEKVALPADEDMNLEDEDANGGDGTLGEGQRSDGRRSIVGPEASTGSPDSLTILTLALSPSATITALTDTNTPAMDKTKRLKRRGDHENSDTEAEKKRKHD